MNYLLKAAKHLGIYCTPSRILVLGYGDGKTEVYASNPPFTAGHKRVRRRIFVPCENCLGSGSLATKNGRVTCSECAGTGEVEKILVEIVADE